MTEIKQTENRWILPVDEKDPSQNLDRIEAGKQVRKLESMPFGLNYVLLDHAAWNIQKAFDLNPEYSCLFATNGADLDLNSVAPYLFTYEKDSDFARWLDKNEKDGEKVLYLHSDLSLKELRKHFRRFLRVQNENKKWLFFRFYDPNVAPLIFPNLTILQAHLFFSGVSYFAYSDRLTKERKVIVPSVEAKQLIDKKDKVIYSTLLFTDEQLKRMVDDWLEFIEQKVKSDIKSQKKIQENELDKMISQAKNFGMQKEQELYDFVMLAIQYPQLLNKPLDVSLAIIKVDTSDNKNKLDRIKAYFNSKTN